MSTKARTSIRAQLMRLSLVIVVVSIALSLVGTLSYTLHTEQQSLDSNLINSASILAQVPLVQSALLDELPAEDLADFLDETTARTSDIDLILVTGRANILRYVPDREMTGTLDTGTAPRPALGGPGSPRPAGLWSGEISFYGEEDRPVHPVLKSWRGSDSSDSLQLEQLSWEGFTSVPYCQPEYDRRSVWYLETTDPAFYTARGIRVGSTRAEVENAYRTLQDPPFNGQEFPGVWYSSQEGRLKPAILFFFEDGLVSRIAVDFRTH